MCGNQLIRWWRGCISADGQTMLILYKNAKLAWLYVYDFIGEDLVLRDQEPILVTQARSFNVYFLNEKANQAVV